MAMVLENFRKHIDRKKSFKDFWITFHIPHESLVARIEFHVALVSYSPYSLHAGLTISCYCWRRGGLEMSCSSALPRNEGIIGVFIDGS